MPPLLLPARVLSRSLALSLPHSLTRECLFIQGLFEIIELTHLSDGERRNAKRSPGEVPAAPAPKPSLPPNSTVITPQQMGLLPLIAAASMQHTHTHTLSRVAATGRHTPARAHTHTHTHAEVPSLPDSRHRGGGRTETCTAHIWSLAHTTHTYVRLPDLTCTLGRSLFFFLASFFCVQGRRRPSATDIDLLQQG